jgi:hypothetical protein
LVLNLSKDRPCLANEDEAPWIEAQLDFLPQGAASRDIGVALLAGEELFFEAGPLAAQKTPQSVAGHGDAALAHFGNKRMQRQIRLFGKTAEKKAPLAFQKTRPFAAHRLRRHTASVVRPRRDHFTTLATLTSKAAATGRQVPPRATIATTRSRRAREYARAIHAGLLPPARRLNQITADSGIPNDSTKIRGTLKAKIESDLGRLE